MNYIKIKKITKLKNKETVYDIETETDHSFFGNGIAIHNSFDPNTQNFTTEKEFRKVFIPPKDFVIAEPDYSGFQLRLMGIYSNDKDMIDAFVNKSGDIHSETGHAIFCSHVDFDYFIKHKDEEPYKTARYNGKVLNLSLVFGYTPHSFQNKIQETWSDEQIDNYILENKLTLLIDKKTEIENKYLTVATSLYDKFFNKYSMLKEYTKKTKDLAAKQGWVDCPIFPGLRRHLPELLKKGSNLRGDKLSHYSTLENIAVNAGAQGGEALLMDQSLVKIHNEIKNKKLESRIFGMVHDSIPSYLHNNEIESMYYIFKKCMENFNYSIPILCEVKIGSIWGFGKKITEKDFIKT